MSDVPASAPSTSSRRDGPTPLGRGAIRRCTVSTEDGEALSDAVVVLIPRAGAWEARVTEFAHPGAFLGACIGRGQRRFRIAVTGRGPLLAELVDTTWQPHGRRLARFQVPIPERTPRA